MVKKIKNNTETTKNWCGQEILADEYYSIQIEENAKWANDSTVLSAIGSADALMNDGTIDITDVSIAINFLKDNAAKSNDNKQFVLQTSRPLGTQIYFTSEGDDDSDPTLVGGGEAISIVHATGDPTEQTKTIKFNIKENSTFLHEGYLIWGGAVFDSVSMSIVPEVTVTSAGTNTFFNNYGPIVIPAAGDGTVIIAPEDIMLVENPIGIDFCDRKPGFWNADYNSTTHEFENITAAPLGNGAYNMFNTEIVLNRFVNKVLMLDDGFMMMQSAESVGIGHGMKFKFTTLTNGTDHNWKATIILTMHRQKTC